MPIVGIPEAIHDFNIYRSGEKMYGGVTGEVKLPDLESMTSTVSGTGILGEYEAILPGHYGSMEQEIPFRCISEDYFSLINPSSAVDLTLRGTIQYTDRATQTMRYMGMRVVVRGRCKKIQIGTVKQHGAMDSLIVLEPTYILIEMDGTPRFELDKLNSVFKVNGEDLLEQVRQLT